MADNALCFTRRKEVFFHSLNAYMNSDNTHTIIHFNCEAGPNRRTRCPHKLLWSNKKSIVQICAQLDTILFIHQQVIVQIFDKKTFFYFAFIDSNGWRAITYIYIIVWCVAQKVIENITVCDPNKSSPRCACFVSVYRRALSDNKENYLNRQTAADGLLEWLKT